VTVTLRFFIMSCAACVATACAAFGSRRINSNIFAVQAAWSKLLRVSLPPAARSRPSGLKATASNAVVVPPV
jgi:hypothetical protein